MKLDDRYEMQIVVVEQRPDGTPGDVDTSMEIFREYHPHSGYRFGFVVVDSETGHVPDVCNEWNSSPEEALADYHAMLESYGPVHGDKVAKLIEIYIDECICNDTPFVDYMSGLVDLFGRETLQRLGFEEYLADYGNISE